MFKLVREGYAGGIAVQAAAIEAGTALPGAAPVKLLVWVGDNIQDFPDQSQSLRERDEAAFADFGVRFFALPNPVYGTWEKNAPR